MSSNTSTGGIEGADRTSRTIGSWSPSRQPMDALIGLGAKDTADYRARDMLINDGYAQGAASMHKDSIVGTQYRLNSMPNLKALGFLDYDWEDEFQEIVEARFNLAAESPRAYFDRMGINDFTAMVRLVVGLFFATGEVTAVVDWLEEENRPFNTAIQLVNSNRLSNPNNGMDTQYLRSGVEIDSKGRPTHYHFRNGEQYDMYGVSHEWRRVPAATPWGRQQVIHIMEQRLADQHRGIADMVSVLKKMRMTAKYQDVVLQQAVLQATYAAVIESELPREIVSAQMGEEDPTGESALAFLSNVAEYSAGRDIMLNDVKVPVLFPNTKLNLKQLSDPAGIGANFEESLLRHTAAGLGLSYEQFSRDYSKTNYSSARASMSEAAKSMQSRKKMVADRFATSVFRLWLEEEINNGTVPLPKGKGLKWFYSNPLHLDALAGCSWIGASRAQIDELKETQAAMLRIEAGFSTREIECAAMGRDWRDMFRQLEREKRVAEQLGINLTTDNSKTKPKPTRNTDDADTDNDVKTEDKTDE